MGYTDGTGTALIPVSPLPPVGAQITLTVTGYNRETVIQTIPVAVQNNAIVEIASSGAGPLYAVAGAPTDLSVLLHNAGSDTAHAVTAVLRQMGGAATVQDSTAAYGNIAPLASVSSGLDTYRITPDPNLPDSSLISFSMDIRSTDYTQWTDTLAVRVLAPVFAYQDAIIDDNLGDEDGRMDHGESCLITVRLRNLGSADASQIDGTLSSRASGVTISQAHATLTTLRAGESAFFTGTFTVDVLPTLFEGDVAFSLYLTTDAGREQVVYFSLPAGGYLETVEYGTPFCSHDADSSYVDEWHVTDTANVTVGGTHAWKCGAIGDGGYAPLNDARLVATPQLQILGAATLSFWHKMSAEVDTLQTGVAFDGGLVEYSTDGVLYQPLVPAGGYPYVIHDRGNGGALAEGTGCYSGAFDWTKVVIDLSSYAGTIQIRFRFASDGEGTGLGWWIDDVDVQGLDATVDAPESIVAPNALALGPASPNPFNPRTRMQIVLPDSGPVRLQIVDAGGRIVRTLLNETCPAGERSVIWDGRSDAGRTVPSGVYYARLDHAGSTRTGRLVMLK